MIACETSKELADALRAEEQRNEEQRIAALLTKYESEE